MSNFLKEHKRGVIGTIIFHVIAIVILLIFGFSTPLPLPGEEGILINFGDDDQGYGQFEPRESESRPAQTESRQESTPQETVQQTTDATEEIITQDFEESAVVEQKKVETKQETKKDPTPKEEIKEEPKEEPKEEKKVNPLALYGGKDKTNESSTSEGETTGDGNQGSKVGSTESDNHVGGDSKGTGIDDVSLEGRNPESLPKPEYTHQVSGKVVVQITVDKYGNVTNAVPGVKGSTTLDSNLLQAAKKAALKAKFDKKPDAPAYQNGTITYLFKLQ